MSLIDNLTSELLALPTTDLKRLLVVFPNRRAGLFLRRQLSLRANKPLWLPEILSVEEVFSRWSGYAVADNLSLVVELIKQQLGNGQTGGHEAAAFIGYARQMAMDFDDIDHSLADPETLFNALNAARAAETWHPDGSELSPYEKDYLGFFQSLFQHYSALKRSLGSRGLLWAGAIAALLAQRNEEQWLETLAESEVWFAGFNALTPAEEKVMTTLCGMGKAKMFWDFDEYYVQDGPSGLPHQAGLWIRKFKKKHPELAKHWFCNNLTSLPRKIVLVSASGAIAQAKALGAMLNKKLPEPSATDEAIVLADEKLLEPVLNSLPNGLDNVNITMGYPLVYSPLFQLAEKTAKLAVYPGLSAHGGLPLLMLVDILNHPLITGAPNAELGAACKGLANKLASDGSSNIFPERLEELIQDLPVNAQEAIKSLLALQQAQAHELPAALLSWMMWPGLVDLTNSLLTRQFHELRRLLNNLSQALSSSGLEARSAIPLLLRQLGQNAHIRLSGEPLKGLQVMGMLETRNLAFRRVHLLSANEGALPAAKNYSSLIPADIRRHFGLPLRTDKDAIAAYHFYHLLQHTHELVFYYNTETDPLGGGEMSRYLLQIKHQLMQANTAIVWEEMAFNPPLPSGTGEAKIEIAKTEAILKALTSKARDGLSPSALSRFFNCSLQFYFSDILNLKEKNLPGELPGFNVTGTIIHKAIELLYHPFINQALSKSTIENMQQNLESAVAKAFEAELPGVSTAFGRNALHHAIVKKMVMRVLDFDRKNLEQGIPITVLQQEKKMEAIVETKTVALKLKGYPDRIDTVGKTIRIIDYKTGTFKDKMLNIYRIEDLLDPEKKYAFQLACYALMVKKMVKRGIDSYDGKELAAYILPLKYRNMGLQEARLIHNNTNYLDDFEVFLITAIARLFDPSEPITQTNDLKRCQHCSYLRICNREAIAAH